jgi:hypothetical protein
MDVAVAVRVGNIAVVNVFEPVIGRDRAAVMQDKPAKLVIDI